MRAFFKKKYGRTSSLKRANPYLVKPVGGVTADHNLILCLEIVMFILYNSGICGFQQCIHPFVKGESVLESGRPNIHCPEVVKHYLVQK